VMVTVTKHDGVSALSLSSRRRRTRRHQL
jgi:hypothetical protein